MSADKDRGIRREKQKRAKDRKKRARQQHQPATLKHSGTTSESPPRGVQTGPANVIVAQ